MSDDLAHYVFDIQVRAARRPPPRSNRAAPESADIAEAATRAARRVIEDAGYTIAGTGHGAYRSDLKHA